MAAIVPITVILLVLTLSGYGIAVLAGKLRLWIALTALYSREYLLVLMSRAHHYTNIVRATMARTSRPTMGRSGDRDMTQDQIAQIATAVVTAITALEQTAPSAPTPVPPVPVDAGPTTTLVGLQSPVAPVPLVTETIAPPAPIVDTTVPQASGDVIVHVDSDGHVSRVQRVISESLTVDVTVEGRDNSAPGHRTMMPPVGSPAVGRLLIWSGRKGRPCRGVIVGANRSGKLRVQRLNKSGDPIGAIMYKSGDAVYAPGDSGVSVRVIRESSPARITATGEGISLEAPVPVPVPVEVVAPEPTTSALDIMAGETLTPDQSDRGVAAIPPAPVPTPAPERKTKTAPKTTARLSIPGTGDRQTFAPTDRVVVFVSPAATLARTSTGVIRWLSARGSKGLAAIQSPESRKGFHAYQMTASQLQHYLSTRAYS